MLETLAFTRDQLDPNEQFLDALRCTLIDETNTAPLLIPGLLVATDTRVLFIAEEDNPEVTLRLSYHEIMNIRQGSSTANPSLLFATEKKVYHFIHVLSTNMEYFKRVTLNYLHN